MDVRDVLDEMVKHIRNAARNLDMALDDMETVDAFYTYTKKAQKDIEALLKYIEDNPQNVSAAMRRPELRRAQKALRDALSCIKESVYTLEDPHAREALYLPIDTTMRRLKGPED